MCTAWQQYNAAAAGHNTNMNNDTTHQVVGAEAALAAMCTAAREAEQAA
jgi:hypothetical protein